MAEPTSATAAAASADQTDAIQALMRGDLAPLQELATDHEFLLKSVTYAGVSLVMLVASYFVARLFSRWTSAALCKRVDETLGRFAGKFVFYAVICCAGVGIMGTAGINVASIAAVMTAAGFAIGLAFQGTLSNVAAGILLLVFRPFKVGDVIVAAGVTGKVNEIDLFTTTLDTPDNRRLIVPNSSIAGATVENITFHAHRRVEVMVGVEYRADLMRTREVLTQAAENLRSLLIDGENRGYQVLLTQLGPHSVDWTIRFWAATANFAKAKECLTQEVKARLDEAGIAIPFPQLHLHVEPTDAGQTTSETPSRVKPRLRNPFADAG